MSKKQTRYYLDTEFHDDGESIMPISIALIDDDGVGLCIELEFDVERADGDPWIAENVLPHLHKDPEMRMSKEEAAATLEAFIAEKPVFWSYYGAYDWVVMCQLFGGMLNLPDQWPKYFREIVVEWKAAGLTKQDRPPKPENAHDALADAKWHREMIHYLDRSQGVNT